jgi:hypothetical protein
MSTITLADPALRHLKPAAGKRVQYLDKTLKDFGLLIAGNGLVRCANAVRF